MSEKRKLSSPMTWAAFRVSVIGTLLASPPEDGKLGAEIEALAKRTWTHPIKGSLFTLSAKTIERWYYKARHAPDPVATLAKKVRTDHGSMPTLTDKQREYIERQYRQHRSWSYQLHVDNIRVALAETSDVPSYDTIRRFMKSRGFIKSKKTRSGDRESAQATARHFDNREIRGYEVSFNGGLWHLDFHSARRQIITPSGERATPKALCMLDDRTRLACHIQWYFSETTEDLVHGFIQACLKRGLPRALMSDNGSAMISAEFTGGLERLGIVHETTLPYSPHQNGKQEFFWSRLEGRLMAMLEGVTRLDLKTLNDATQAWVEMEYNHSPSSEMLGLSPYERWKAGPTVMRPAIESAALRQAFRLEVKRRQRRSDSTILLEGRRFEVPAIYRAHSDITIRYARWDLASVDMVDPKTGTILAALFPEDKSRNADGRRRIIGPVKEGEPSQQSPDEIAPLIKKLMADYAATGLPPAYIAKGEATR